MSQKKYVFVVIWLVVAMLIGACAAPAAAPAGEGGEAAAPVSDTTVLTFGRHWEAAFRPHQEGERGGGVPREG